MNYSQKLSINSNISQLTIKMSYNLPLDTGILHPLVFEKATGLYVGGTIQSIQPGLFKTFQTLKYMYFSLNSVGNFFHQIGVEWMTYVADGSFIVIVISLEHENLKTLYTYPDRDFCLFAAYFPLNKSIFLYLTPGLNSSLTYEWLCMHAGVNGYPCNERHYTIDEFNAQLKLCYVNINETNNSNVYTLYPNYYQIKLINLMFMEIVPFVLIPCACILGLLFNWKIIKTIRSNKSTTQSGLLRHYEELS
jgi:hypothetical protein